MNLVDYKLQGTSYMTDYLLVMFTAVLAFVGWQQLLSSRTQVHLGLFEKRFGSIRLHEVFKRGPYKYYSPRKH